MWREHYRIGYTMRSSRRFYIPQSSVFSFRVPGPTQPHPQDSAAMVKFSIEQIRELMDKCAPVAPPVGV